MHRQVGIGQDCRPRHPRLYHQDNHRCLCPTRKHSRSDICLLHLEPNPRPHPTNPNHPAPRLERQGQIRFSSRLNQRRQINSLGRQTEPELQLQSSLFQQVQLGRCGVQVWFHWSMGNAWCCPNLFHCKTEWNNRHGRWKQRTQSFHQRASLRAKDR